VLELVGHFINGSPELGSFYSPMIPTAFIGAILCVDSCVPLGGWRLDAWEDIKHSFGVLVSATPCTILHMHVLCNERTCTG
jgi:hypothetical protein